MKKLATIFILALALMGASVPLYEQLGHDRTEPVMVVSESTSSGDVDLEQEVKWEGDSDLVVTEIVQLSVDSLDDAQKAEMDAYEFHRNSSMKAAGAYYYDAYYNSLDEEEKEIFQQLTQQVTNDHPGAVIQTNIDMEKLDKVLGRWPWSISAAHVYELMQATIYVVTDQRANKYYVQFCTRPCDRNAFEQKLNECVSSAKQYSDLYQREKAIHDWVISNVRYDHDGMRDTFNQTAGSIASGKSVCAGISKFINLANLYCNIQSNVIVTQEHAFNYVYVEGKTFLEDATWCLEGPAYGWFLIGRYTRDLKDPSYYYHTAVDYINPPALSESDFDVNRDNVIVDGSDVTGETQEQNDAPDGQNGDDGNGSDEANDGGNSDNDSNNNNNGNNSGNNNNSNSDDGNNSDGNNNNNGNNNNDSNSNDNGNNNYSNNDNGNNNNNNNNNNNGNNGNSNNNNSNNNNNGNNQAQEEKKPEEDVNKDRITSIVIQHRKEYYYGDPVVDDHFSVQVCYADGHSVYPSPSEYTIVGSTRDDCNQVTFKLYYKDRVESFTAKIKMPEAKITYDPATMQCYCSVTPSRNGTQVGYWKSYNESALTISDSGKMTVHAGDQDVTISCYYSFNDEWFVAYANIRTGYSEWGPWSDYGFEDKAAGANREVEHATLYQYYYFYDNVGTHSPLWNTYRGAGYIPEDSYTVVYAPVGFDSCECEWMEGMCFYARSYTGNAIMSNKQGGWDPVSLTDWRIYVHESWSTITAMRYRERYNTIVRFE